MMQVDCLKFQASLGYIVRPRRKKTWYFSLPPYSSRGVPVPLAQGSQCRL